MPIKPDFGLDLQGIPLELFKLIRDVAKNAGINRIALTGGVVRDALLHDLGIKYWQGAKDIDLIIEGSASKLAKELQYALGTERLSELRIHQAYDTVEMRVDGTLIDLTTARLENYSAPGQNPQITPSNIEQDLARRDFTVNSIALDISTDELRLIDPFGGVKDLEKGELNFLHDRSVEEDPTRIIRGARYAARLGLEMSPNSLKQICSTLQNWPWDLHVTKEACPMPPAMSTRLRLELELLLTQEPWEEALKNLQEWEAFVLLEQKLQYDQQWRRRIRWAKKLKVEPLTAFIAGANNPISLATRLDIPKKQIELLAESLKLEDLLSSIATNELSHWLPSRWSQEIENANLKPDAIAISICKGVSMWRPLLRWWGRWRQITSPISAIELINQGWQPGPELGAELRRLRATQIDKIRSDNKT